MMEPTSRTIGYAGTAAWFSVLFVALLSTACSYAQQDAGIAKLSAHDRIVAASAAGLSGAPVKNWHLKVEVTTTAAKTKEETAGTIEIWHSPDAERTTYDFPGGKRTDLHAGGKYFSTATSVALPIGVPEVLAAILHPGPKLEDVDASTPQLSHETFSKTPFDCIMLTRPAPKPTVFPIGLFPTYCLMRDTNDLRISYDFGSQTVILRSVGKFGGQPVPLNVDLAEGGSEVARGKVAKLESYQPAEDEFTPTPDMQARGSGFARIASGVISGMKIGGPPPSYPASARASGTSGTVVMHAMIGRDGRIRSLRIMSEPSPDLGIAALAAVRQWTYKPYLLNGEPTEVDTTIVVNFNLGP